MSSMKQNWLIEINQMEAGTHYISKYINLKKI